MARRYGEPWRDDPYHDYDWDNDGFPGQFVYGDDIYIDDYYMEEVWKPIRGFEGEYWISDTGRVWSSHTERFLKLKPLDNHGHLGVCLHSNGRAHYRYIHRLVAEAFIPNPNNYPIVRHKDDIPMYNTVDDLLWGTQRDNIRDAMRNGKTHYITKEEREIGLVKMQKPVIAVDIETGEKLYFKSQTEAGRKLGIHQANIWKVLSGERRQTSGYTFKYYNGGESDGCY